LKQVCEIRELQRPSRAAVPGFFWLARLRLHNDVGAGL